MLKIVLITLICGIIIIYLKSMNGELAFLATIGSGIIILIFCVKEIAPIYEFVNKLINMSGIDKTFFKIIFKIVSVGYLVEFGADLVNDFGLTSLSNKLILAGKIIILILSMPIIYALFNIIIGLTQ